LSSDVDVIAPPTFRPPPTPNPPATTNAPVVVEIDAVLLVTAIEGTDSLPVLATYFILALA
jgi:hypothetical protein